MLAEKNFFLQMHNTILQRVNVKMINLKEIKWGKCQRPPLPFKKTCPCTKIPPPFLIFQIPSHLGRSLKFIPHPLPPLRGSKLWRCWIIYANMLLGAYQDFQFMKPWTLSNFCTQGREKSSYNTKIHTGLSLEIAFCKMICT